MAQRSNPHEMARSPYGTNRRHMLQLLGLAGSGLLAGCMGGDGDGDGNDPDDRDVHDLDEGDDEPESVEELEHVNQEFRLPMSRSTEEVHFFHIDQVGFFEWEYFTTEHPAYGPWAHSDYLGQGELNLRQFDDVDMGDDRIEITVRDDVRWSNGDEMLGRDVIMGPIEQRLSAAAMPFEDVEERGPSMPWDAITDYEYDGKRAVLHSDGGYFGDLIDQNIWLHFFIETAPAFPTTVEPFDEYADRIYETMDRAVDGEIDPWNADEPSLQTEIENDIYGEGGSDRREQWHEHFRDPDNVIVDGAWTLEEIQRDQELWLEPNPEHRNYDLINFDRVVLEVQEEDNAIYALLQGGEYDMAETNPQPQTRREFSSIYETYLAPDNNGTSIVLNHAQEPLGNVRVRQALMAVLDNEALCELMDPLSWEPVKTPGADNPGRPDFLDDEWYEDNLQDYGHDPEFAAELMNEGGFVRDSEGTWVDDDSGDPVELVVYTGDTAPTLESAIEQQFDEFGFVADMTTLEGATMEDNMDRGELQMWTGNHNAGTAYTMVTPWGYVTWHQNIMNRVSWFDGPVEENIEKLPWDDSDFIATNDPEELEVLTIQAPPVGEFYGDLQEYPVRSMMQRFQNGENIEELWPQLLWIGNWYLPALPIANNYKQFFLNTENWHWSSDHEAWDYAAVTSRLMPQDFHSWGDMIFADPENPK